MSFLTVNGIDPDVLFDTFSESIREIGNTSAAFDGTLRKTRLDVKWDVSFDMPVQTAASGYAWDRLVRGMGETWSFDSSLYGSKGLGPNSATGLSIDTGTKFIGAGSMKIAQAGTPNTAVFAASCGSNWTVCHHYKIGASAWGSYVVTSAGHKWNAGARNDAVGTAWLSVSGGSVTLTGSAAADVYIDDLVVLPFVIEDAWGPAFDAEAQAGRAWSLLPELRLGGDIIPETTRTVLGDVKKIGVTKGYSGGSYQALRKLSVEFAEV